MQIMSAIFGQIFNLMFGKPIIQRCFQAVNNTLGYCACCFVGLWTFMCKNLPAVGQLYNV